jgi:hypothetical protein
VKRTVIAGLLLLTIAGITGQARQEAAATRPPHLQVAGDQDANRETPRERQCRFQWIDRGTWTAREERLTTECVLARWPVSGGIDFFSRVIACESGWNRFAYNPNGPYLGLAQHGEEWWPDRVRQWLPERWRAGLKWWRWVNSRTQIVVTARMAHAGGWGPWSCA